MADLKDERAPLDAPSPSTSRLMAADVSSATTAGPPFLGGVTVRDVLRVHELARRLGWEHLLAPRPR